MNHKYNKARYHLDKALLFFETNTTIFYPKHKSNNVDDKPFYMDENGRVKLYDSFKKKCESPKTILGNKSVLYGKELGKSEIIWPMYYIDKIELYDISRGE